MAMDFVSAVGRTALAVAAARLVESRRADRWFDDPLATVLFHDREPPDLPGWLVPSVAVRTRFLDELLQAAVADGTGQIVIVGAGLDARAFRLSFPRPVSVFEVDRTDVLRVKDGLIARGDLTPACRREVVVADVTETGWLDDVSRAGWRRDEPTVWVLEGFLVYFEQAFRERLLRQLAQASASGSVLGATLSSQRGQTTHRLWFPAPETPTRDWVGSTGWVAETGTFLTASSDYGRPIDPAGGYAFGGELLRAGKRD